MLPSPWPHDEIDYADSQKVVESLPVCDGPSEAKNCDFFAGAESFEGRPMDEVSSTTAKLLDSAGLHGSHASLKKWFAWALEQHQEATHRHIDRQHAELKTSLESLIKNHGVQPGRKTMIPRTMDTNLAANCPTDFGFTSTLAPKKPILSILSAEPPDDEELESEEEEMVQGVSEDVERRRRSWKSMLEDMMPTPFSWSRSLRARLCPEITSRRVIRFLQWLDFVAMLMLFFSAVLIFLEYEKHGAELRVQLGLASSDELWTDTDVPFQVIEHFLNGFFIFEIVVRFALLRMALFLEFVNILDVFVVVLNSFSLYSGGEGMSNFVVARFLRVTKMSRVFRLMRKAYAASELRVLIKSLMSSVRSLVWSFMLLALIILAAGIFMTQLMGLYLESCVPDDEICVWSYEHYGSASRACWTMFRATMSGGWQNYADTMINDISGTYVLFWIPYVVTVWFAVIRILTAIFLKQTMEVASADQEMMIAAKIKKKKRYADKLGVFFRSADRNGDAHITFEEFQTYMEDPLAYAFMQALEIDTQEIKGLFEMLDNGDGAISFDEFLGGAVRLKGAATSIDQVSILHTQDKCLARLDQIAETIKVIALQL